MTVADSLASQEPPSSDIVQMSDAHVGDLGEVTFDVVGLGDDAMVGLRVHAFGEPVTEAEQTPTSLRIPVVRSGRGVGELRRLSRFGRVGCVGT